MAREQYGHWGVDTDEAIKVLGRIPISIPCWQGDNFWSMDDNKLLQIIFPYFLWHSSAHLKQTGWS